MKYNFPLQVSLYPVVQIDFFVYMMACLGYVFSFLLHQCCQNTSSFDRFFVCHVSLEYYGESFHTVCEICFVLIQVEFMLQLSIFTCLSDDVYQVVN